MTSIPVLSILSKAKLHFLLSQNSTLKRIMV